MTEQKQPEALQLTNMLRGIDARSRFANEMLEVASEALESLHAENEILRHKLKTLEDLGAGGVGPMIVSLCKERDYLSEGLEAARQEIARLREKNLEIDRLCDTTYVAQGADAYQHACDMMEQHQARRDAAGRDVGAEGSLCDGISWLYGRIAELEAHLEAVGGVGASAHPVAWALQWPDDNRLNISTVFDTRLEATDYLERCRDGVVVVPLYTAPQPAAQVQPYDQREMGLCDKCGWKGVIPYADGPVCVVCEHDKTLMTQPAAQAQDAARYQFLRDGEWRRTDLESVIRLQLNTLWDSKIDAAIAAKQGGANG